MTTSLRSLRCLSRRALARISIIVMFGESSMKSGASAISPIRRASFDQSSSRSEPARMWCSGTFASAESRRMVISCLLISSEKIAAGMWCFTDADRAMSSPRVDLPTPGRAAMTIIWPACRPLVSSSRSRMPVGHAAAHAAAGGDGVELVHRRLQDVLEPRVVLAHPLLGDVVDLLLRAVDDVVDVALAARGAVAQLDDAGAGLDQPPQHGLLGHDRGVVAGVGGRGRRRDQRVQVDRAAHLRQLVGAVELGGDGDRVGRLAPAVEVEDARRR